MQQLNAQPRRLRQREALRRLTRETRVRPDQLVAPLSVRPGRNVRSPIASMPGHAQLGVDQLVAECRELHELKVPAVLLFGVADRKDDRASRGFAKDGVVQQALAAVKAAVPGLLVMTDVCACAYTSHGHCGILKTRQETRDKRHETKKRRSPVSGLLSPVSSGPVFDQEATLDLLARIAVSHAQAGTDLVAPSAMMDGQVGAIRRALDAAGFAHVPIMGYSAKYASPLYAPFREAADSSPAFGDRKTYQLDPANREEALREAALDLEEGADIVMVKPAIGYLDVIRRIKDRFGAPVAAFNVSGEYAMIKAAAARGWLLEQPSWIEQLTCIRRAGADLIITYWAKDAAKYFRTQEKS